MDEKYSELEKANLMLSLSNSIIDLEPLVYEDKDYQCEADQFARDDALDELDDVALKLRAILRKLKHYSRKNG